ncbi:MAG: TlyA family RNA methyltransferase [Candidatus Saccharimonadales bacterium]
MARLDQVLAQRGLVASRSQADSYIKLGQVTLNGKKVTKPSTPVTDGDQLAVLAAEQYVSRAALKLASVAEALELDFGGKVVLDIGSSTGGFTQYALMHGAKQVMAVDVGTMQLHPSLRDDPKIILMEQTDFRSLTKLPMAPDIMLADVSFISLRQILPTALQLGGPQTQYAVMVKPQFEAGDNSKHKGIIKNDQMRRQILKDFEQWAQLHFVIRAKADSAVSGGKGNRERFYLLSKARS